MPSRLQSGLLALRRAAIGGYYLDYRCLSRYAWYIYGAVLVLGAVCVYQTTFMGPGAPRMLGITVGDTSEYAALLYPAAYALVVYALRREKGRLLAVAGSAGAVRAPVLLWDRYVANLCPSILFAAVRGGGSAERDPRGAVPGEKELRAGARVGAAGACQLRGFSIMDAQRYHNFSDWYLSPAGLREWRADFAGNIGKIPPRLPLCWTRGELWRKQTGLAHWSGAPAWVWLAMLYAPQAVLLVMLLVRTAKLQNPLGRMLCIPTGMILSMQLTLGLLYQTGIFPLSAPLPFISGNLYTVMDAALLGLALSTLRQSACPESELCRAWPDPAV